MRLELQYGNDGLEIELPSSNVTIIEPSSPPALDDLEMRFKDALLDPIGKPPLPELVGASETVAIVIPDITRPMPTHVLLPWLLQVLDHVPRGNIVIVSGTGSHRPNTDDELARMVGEDVLGRVRVVNHDAYDRNTCRLVSTPNGAPPLYVNRDYVDADRRILMGFIEPHLMAGFSGGYKAVFPGIIDIDSIMHYHRAAVVGHEGSTWGVLENNPTQTQVRKVADARPADFLINVTLDREHAVTGLFCGDPIRAHEVGCAATKRDAMVPYDQQFPIVITTNAGFPLDLNLYQAVKGMSAAVKIISQGGLMMAAAECRDGFPEHGEFKALMHRFTSPAELLRAIDRPDFQVFDQWEAQILATIQLQCRVALHSTIPATDVERAFIEPVDNIVTRITRELDAIGHDAPIAVMPEGFMAVPYLASAEAPASVPGI